MAVHLSIGRIPSISLLALLGLAVAAGTMHFLSRSGPEAGTASASRITAAVSSPSVLEPRAAEPLLGSPAETAIRHDPEPTMPAERMPDAEAEPEVAAEPKVEVAAESETEVVVVAGAEAEVEAEVEAAPAPAAALAIPPAAAPAADAVQTVSVPVATPTVAPSVAPFAATEPAAPRRRVIIARLVAEPQHPSGVRDSLRSTSRPKNLAPIPMRAPRAAKAGSISVRSAAALFQSGAEIKVRKDANLYITSRNIPENDRLLEAYSVDRPNGGRVQTRLGEAAALPGLLSIAAQAQRSQAGGQGNPAYSLADAMRDAIWRKNTAARLKSLTASQSACANGSAGRTPSIGLLAGC